MEKDERCTEEGSRNHMWTKQKICEMIQSAWQEKWRTEMAYSMTGREKAKAEYKEALKTANMMAKREFYRTILGESKKTSQMREGTKCLN